MKRKIYTPEHIKFWKLVDQFINKEITPHYQQWQQERLTIAVGALGAIEGCLDLTKDYVSSRKVFGKPLCELQNTRLELAEMATYLQLA